MSVLVSEDVVAAIDLVLEDVDQWRSKLVGYGIGASLSGLTAAMLGRPEDATKHQAINAVLVKMFEAIDDGKAALKALKA